MVSLHEEEEPNENKSNNEVQRPHSSEPQKAHFTGEFVVMP